jgi:hypothetical protein
MRRLAFVTACLVLAGCSAVATKSPLGDPLAEGDAKKFEGVWLDADGYPLSVKHIEGNRLRMASVAWNDNRFELAEFNAFVTEDDKVRYINVEPAKDADKDAPFTFLRVMSEEGDFLVIAPPNPEAFDAAIKDGKLSGSTKKKQGVIGVKLDSSTDALNNFVTRADEAAQFQLATPMVLHRVQRPKEEAERP